MVCGQDMFNKLVLAAVLSISLTFSIAHETASDATPSGWQNTSITIPLSARTTLARDALETVMKSFNKSSGQLYGDNYQYTGVLYAQMIELDLFTDESQFQEALSTYFPLAEALKPAFLHRNLISPILRRTLTKPRYQLNYGVMYGLAALRAYATYKDKTYIGYAETAWSSLREYTLSDSDVQTGKSAVKSITYPSGCGGASLAGGSFQANKSDAQLVGLSTGNFMILSAMLAEATGNQTYFVAAAQSLDFLRSQLYDGKRGLLEDGISAATCAPKADFLPYNTGFMIEGLAVLVSVAKNETMLQFLQDTVRAAIYTTEWNASNGSMNHTDWYIIHALSTVYKRNVTDAGLQRLIFDYLAIQYNTALNSRTSQDPQKQTIALTYLVSGILLENSTTTPLDSPFAPLATETPQRSKNKEPAIIGAAVGTTVFLVLTGIGVWLLWRRYRPQGGAREKEKLADPVMPYPVDHQPVMLGSTNHIHDIGRWYNEIPHPSKKQRMIAEGHQDLQSPRLHIDHLPTEQLVRVLQARSELRHGDSEEVPPPEYFSTVGDHPRLALTLAAFSILFTLGVAQKTSVSTALSDWLNASITIPLSERTTLARDALATVMESFNRSSGQLNGNNHQYSGVLYSQIAELDLITGATEFREALLTYFLLAKALKRGFLNQ
ncbi:hypothetical protein PQX77_004932 [Marasmius sp. AFHP31]|nr:hypothetical protein PQX77_004932 [Marasmius sp. AFHP31]